MVNRTPVVGGDTEVAVTSAAQLTDEPALPGSDEPTKDGDERFVFPRWVRWSAVIYVAIGIPLTAAVFWEPRAPHEYLSAMLVLNVAFIGPAFVLAVGAALRSPPEDRVPRWMWAVALGAGLLAVTRQYSLAAPDVEPGLVRPASPAFFALIILLVANGILLRARSGERAALVDAVDLVMATIALSVPLVLAFGHAVLDSPHSWFTVSASVWMLVAIHGILVSLVIRSRVHPQFRLLANIGVAFGSAVLVSTIGHVVLGVGGFDAPAGPFLAAYVLAIAFGAIFFAFATVDASPGLERLPVGQQVRRSSLISLVVIGTVPVTGAIVWWQRDVAWVPVVAVITGLALLALSNLRHLLAAREALRLHEIVERDAAERSRLLSEVMAHMDTDRHRAATHLHTQAARLYTAIASLGSAIDQAAESGSSAAVGHTAERLRRDLAQQADSFRRIAEAIKPLAPAEAGTRRLSVAMAAYLEELSGDGPRADLSVEIDPDLSLDWHTEAVVLRIAQHATLQALWYAGATTVSISVTAEDNEIIVAVTDDGRGEEEPRAALATMQSLTRFMGGDLTTGTVDDRRVLRAVVPTAMAAPTGTEGHLRLVREP